MTRLLSTNRLVSGLLLLPWVASFHPDSIITTSRSYCSTPYSKKIPFGHSSLSSKHHRFRHLVVALASDWNQDDDFLVPETSFGAEAVPEGQRPVNEYLNLMQQPLFDWASEKSGTLGLAIRLSLVYLVSFAAVSYPIAGATFTHEGFLTQKLAAGNVGALLVVLLVLMRIYTGWGYVGARLKSKVIEYEETGWFDGDFEKKSVAEQKRDQFLYQANVKPVIDRVKFVTLAVGGIWLASCVGLNAALSVKPIFDEYNPEMLERLRYDDKLAEKAATQSGGKPTYCDNRYYRALANGGTGCDD